MHRTLILSAILTMASMAQAAADCETSDLDGRWAYFDITSVAGEDGVILFALTKDCTFTIEDAVIEEVSCGGGHDFPDELREEFLGVEIQLESNCRFEMIGGFCEYFGQILRDKISGAGVALCGDFDRISFDLVKE
jgi:hypothetical protein